MKTREILIYILSTCIALLCFALGVLACLICMSCTEQSFTDDFPVKEATVFIGVSTNCIFGTRGTSESATRATISEYEVKSAVVLVYNANKVFEKSGSLGEDHTLQLTLREGKKYIYVIANPGTALKNQLDASPTYTQLGEMISTSDDYANGNYPSQGLLMTGTVEQTISTGQKNEVTIPLNIRTARVDLYVNKGSTDVEDVKISSVNFQNAHTTGYLFKTNVATATVSTNPVTLIGTNITGVTTDGTLVGTQYTYPAISVSNISFQVTLKHANASIAEVYTVFLNDTNSGTAITLQQGYHYKVLITFSKDETGTLNISGYTSKNNSFDIG